MVRVVMLQHARGLNPGEVAGFSEEEAKQLIEAKIARAAPAAEADLYSIVGSLSDEARALLKAKFDQEVTLAREPLLAQVQQLEAELAETKAKLSKLEHAEPPKAEEKVPAPVETAPAEDPIKAVAPVEPPPSAPEPPKAEDKPAETKAERRRR